MAHISAQQRWWNGGNNVTGIDSNTSRITFVDAKQKHKNNNTVWVKISSSNNFLKVDYRID